MRIALHASAAAALRGHRRIMELPKVQDGASHEWNYLPIGNNWRGSQAAGFNRDAFRRQIEKMASESESDPAIQVHYTETFNAVDRMVQQMHDEWLQGPQKR